jgi:hypothetical protein
MLSKCAIALLGMALSAPFSRAQLRDTGMSLPFVRGPGFAPHHVTAGFHVHSHHASPGAWLGTPLWYGDYTTGPEEPGAPEPQVVVVETQPASQPAPPVKLPEPLLIELQGDHYVRLLGGDAAQQGKPTEVDYAKSAAAKPPAAAKGTPEAKSDTLPPVVLIYRDGHHADVHDYTIVDGTIYARGDYWTDGYWEKKIQISALNVPATIKTNQQHGVRFLLPTSPNEVITRP